jgi:predicted TIM-barrel fold metal-dependent hydrolase
MMKIVDAHVHIGEMDSRSKHFGTAPRKFMADDMIELMDRNHVDVVVANSMGRILNEDHFRKNNLALSEATSRFPDRIIAFVRVNPWLEDCVDHMRLAVREWGFKGLKLHPITESFQANDEIVHPLMEEAVRLRIPVQIHSHQPGSQPALIGDLADRFPDATIIMAHMGMALYKDAIFVARKCPNVVLETSAQPWTHRICRTVIDNVGPERLVFGSDAPLHHQEIELRKIQMAGLSDADLEFVLGTNMARILRLGA